MAKITIYGRANSINVRKVLFLCDEIGLVFDRHDYGRGFKPADSPEYRALNPHALVPTVVDGDGVVWESNTILRYLNARYGRDSLHPKEPLARAHVEQWMDWQLGHFQPAITAIFFGRFLKNPDYDKPDVIEAAITRVAAMMRRLSDQIERAGGYVAGDDLTLADMAIGPGVHRWYALVPDAEELAPLKDYYARLSQRPAYKKHILIGVP